VRRAYGSAGGEIGVVLTGILTELTGKILFFTTRNLLLGPKRRDLPPST
jgi:hypothetical protein